MVASGPHWLQTPSPRSDQALVGGFSLIGLQLPCCHEHGTLIQLSQKVLNLRAVQMDIIVPFLPVTDYQ